MLTDSEGIVLRQIKTAYNRKMIQLFTRKFGRISAGTGIGEKRKGKSALALRPFTLGRYEFFKSRDSYSINSAEVISSFYGIGEDVEKYLQGSYVLEFTARALPEEMPAPELFDQLVEFFQVLEHRQRGLGTLVLAYQVKLLALSGTMPVLDRCVVCGEEKPAHSFSIREGGVVCEDCVGKLQKSGDTTLIYCASFGIVDILKYFVDHRLKQLEKIALNEETGSLLQRIVREYAAYHLDITDMKSEKLV